MTTAPRPSLLRAVISQVKQADLEHRETTTTLAPPTVLTSPERYSLNVAATVTMHVISAAMDGRRLAPEDLLLQRALRRFIEPVDTEEVWRAAAQRQADRLAQCLLHNGDQTPLVQ